jgi:hypothetical protein
MAPWPEVDLLRGKPVVGSMAVWPVAAVVAGLKGSVVAGWLERRRGNDALKASVRMTAVAVVLFIEVISERVISNQ